VKPKHNLLPHYFCPCFAPLRAESSSADARKRARRTG
jgi:hypothetical protein